MSRKSLSREIFPRSRAAASRFMASVGADPGGVDAMLPKCRFHTILLPALKVATALVLKQEALSKGAEAAIPGGALRGHGPCDVLLMGTEAQLKYLCESLKFQPFKEMKRIISIITDIIKHGDADFPRWKVRNSFITKPETAIIMGIVNVTPDSFSDGGKFYDADAAIAHGRKLAEEGADILDIGGESSRPGAEEVSIDEELNRIIPVIKALSELSIPISADTRKPEVAKEAVSAGASIINDINGCRDKKMIEVAAATGSSLVIMHMKGTPENMQKAPQYDDVISEILGFLLNAANKAIEAGIEPDRISLDPGIGFGKTLQHNLEIIDRIGEFSSTGFPVLMGASRKSMIGSILNTPDASDRLEGSLAIAMISAMRGASILRVHDVLQTSRVLKVMEAVNSGGGGLRQNVETEHSWAALNKDGSSEKAIKDWQ